MNKQEKLTLGQAILININVMFGSGVFINTVNLINFAGILSFVSYCVAAIILLPIIFSITTLIKKFPEGGFYVYAARTISPFFGFLSAWSYFIGKLASTALLIHIFTMLIQSIIPALALLPAFFIDSCIIALFMWLNHYALQTGTKIMYGFIFLKATPIVIAILSSLYLFGHWHAPETLLLWDGIPKTIPLVLYAFVGFETACSLSLTIQNPEKNARKAILYSFLATISITIMYQLLTSLALGSILFGKENFLAVFPSFFNAVLGSSALSIHLANIVHIAAATAALGGSYGMILSNAWNLYILAQHNHIFYAPSFVAKNKYGIPFLCILAEGFICISYLILTGAQQIVLQQISIFALSIAFLLSCAGLLVHDYKKQENLAPIALPVLGCISVLILFTLCIRNFTHQGFFYLAAFLVTVGTGCIMFFIKKINASSASLRQSSTR
ncbi:MAG: APC family permease [Candidatus Babeliales bacterium]